ncbi:unnamed protein product [Echinostoma caproni]|uniref:Ion_trans domain-containing protein n=1 Tax=Echinostoma caproni TaxID=27848 RepID=A0A183A623_9TREM|nr:unnamed protein product [Echinostoma caproni]
MERQETAEHQADDRINEATLADKALISSDNISCIQVPPNTVVSGDQSRIKDAADNQGYKNRWKKVPTVVRFVSLLSREPMGNQALRRDSFIDRFTNRRPVDDTNYTVRTCMTEDSYSPWSVGSSGQHASISKDDKPNKSNQSSPATFVEKMLYGVGTGIGIDRRSVDEDCVFPFDLIPDQEKMRVLGKKPCGLPCIFQPYSLALLVWLTAVSLAVLYNLWLPIARQAFYELQAQNTLVFLILDLCADLIYLLDFVVQLGTTYLECGLVVINRRKLALRYVKSCNFRMDVISIIPLDLLQLKLGSQPMLRFPRFVKIYRARLWKIKIENRSLFPNVWRVLNSIHVLFLGCHWFACIYYMISKYEKFDSPWAYKPENITAGVNLGRRYLKCYYWATLALTTIGIEEGPVTNVE